MTGSLSPRARGLLALGGAGLVAALAAGRPELAVLAGPFLVFVGLGLVLTREPRVTGGIELDRTRLLEGDGVATTVKVGNIGPGAVEVELALAHTGRLGLGPAGPVLVRLRPGDAVDVEFAVRPEKWGAHTIGPLIVRARDPLGLTTWDGTLGRREAVRVFPREQQLRELVAPRQTRPFLGTHVARARGQGIEFADTRPFRVGDRVRHVHWRATARRGAARCR